MKKIFLLVMTLFSVSSFAQSKDSKNNPIQHPKTPAFLDTTLTFEERIAQHFDSTAIYVSYQKTPVAYIHTNEALIINGQLTSYFDLRTLNIDVVGTFNVKEDTIINGHTYNVSILIGTKDGYTPDYITLNDLKRKHTSIEAGSSIFMIDERFISGNYEKITVDEKYILKIEVSKVSIPVENVDMNVIRLTTRTKANIEIEKSKEFMIRGGTAVAPATNYFDNGAGVERQKATVAKGRAL